MKTYLGFCAFFRHDPDEALIPHFEMRCAAFVLLQEMAHDNKQTLQEALHRLSQLTIEHAHNCLIEAWNVWADFLVVSTTQTSLTLTNKLEPHL